MTHDAKIVLQGGGFGVETAKSWYLACSCGYSGRPRRTRFLAAEDVVAHLLAAGVPFDR